MTDITEERLKEIERRWHTSVLDDQSPATSWEESAAMAAEILRLRASDRREAKLVAELASARDLIGSMQNVVNAASILETAWRREDHEETGDEEDELCEAIDAYRVALKSRAALHPSTEGKCETCKGSGEQMIGLQKCKCIKCNGTGKPQHRG